MRLTPSRFRLVGKAFELLPWFWTDVTCCEGECGCGHARVFSIRTRGRDKNNVCMRIHELDNKKRNNFGSLIFPTDCIAVKIWTRSLTNLRAVSLQAKYKKSRNICSWVSQNTTCKTVFQVSPKHDNIAKNVTQTLRRPEIRVGSWIVSTVPQVCRALQVLHLNGKHEERFLVHAYKLNFVSNQWKPHIRCGKHLPKLLGRDRKNSSTIWHAENSFFDVNIIVWRCFYGPSYMIYSLHLEAFDPRTHFLTKWKTAPSTTPL